jgi:NADPH:quinone reductase-like Zn-dependent oxidoreductase
MRGLRKPKFKIIGNDIAGCVGAVGRNVTKFRPGDEAFGERSRCGFFVLTRGWDPPNETHRTSTGLLCATSRKPPFNR